jgi:pimeloyl-ACP methyl ester carboxylesterase
MIKRIEIAGKRIMYRVYGKGNPVVLIHGFGETGDVWEKQIAHLEKDFQLIIPDLPGSGESEIIDDMSMEGLAEVIKKILEASPSRHGGTKGGASPRSKTGAVLIGHSMGGYITLAFAEKYSTYLSAFGLFHSTAFADSDEKKEIRKKGIEFVQKHGAFEFLKTSSPNLFSPVTKDQKPELIDDFIRSLQNFSSEAVISYYKAMMQRPDRTNLLKTTPLPVLFVLGKYDNAVPFNDSLKLAHMPEKAYIHILYLSGHMGMLEEDEKSKYILHKFLSETPALSAQ